MYLKAHMNLIHIYIYIYTKKKKRLEQKGSAHNIKSDPKNGWESWD